MLRICGVATALVLSAPAVSHADGNLDAMIECWLHAIEPPQAGPAQSVTVRQATLMCRDAINLALRTNDFTQVASLLVDLKDASKTIKR